MIPRQEAEYRIIAEGCEPIGSPTLCDIRPRAAEAQVIKFVHSKTPRLKNIYGARGQEHHDRERDERLHHHSDLCPARKRGGIRGRKGGAGVEGEKKIIDELRRPRGWGIRHKRLRKKKRAVELSARRVASQGSS